MGCVISALENDIKGKYKFRKIFWRSCTCAFQTYWTSSVQYSLKEHNAKVGKKIYKRCQQQVPKTNLAYRNGADLTQQNGIKNKPFPNICNNTKLNNKS